LYEYLIFIFLLDESGVIKVLLEHREQDRVRLEENVLVNVRKLVSPYLLSLH
jgi:hypothetical protein